MQGKAKGGATVEIGDWGLKALEPHWVTARQIEACRVAMVRTVKRSGKVVIRIFPDKPVSQRAADSRMGKGKGNVEKWVAVVKPGRILFEIEGVPDDLAKAALRKASAKLPILTKIVARHAIGGE
jgi:large subunit ribosomal protein L16